MSEYEWVLAWDLHRGAHIILPASEMEGQKGLDVFGWYTTLDAAATDLEEMTESYREATEVFP